MSLTKVIRREGCKNAFSRCLAGLALAVISMDGAGAGRVALFPEINGARAVMRPAADGHQFFVYSSSGGPTIAPVRPADLIHAALARKLSMEVEMKTGHQKADKKDTQLNSPAGATPAVMFPKKSDEDSPVGEPKPAKAPRASTTPKRRESR
jgi:hypothetical protein